MIPDLPGVLSADDVEQTAQSIAALQLPSGMIQWYPGGHADPWNHVETAMALSVAGRWHEAELAYQWLIDKQLPDGSWHNYYRADGSIEDHKLDTNVIAYIATGVWHHWQATGDRGFVDHPASRGPIPKRCAAVHFCECKLCWGFSGHFAKYGHIHHRTTDEWDRQSSLYILQQ